MKPLFATVFIIACNSLISCSEPQSARDNGGSQSDSPKPTQVVDVQIMEIVRPTGTQWEQFQGVLKCTVLNAKGSKVEKGQQLNILAVKPEAAKKGYFEHRGGKVLLEKGSRYTVSIDETLPKGWDVIRDEFDDIRIGLVALIAVEKLAR